MENSTDNEITVDEIMDVIIGEYVSTQRAPGEVSIMEIVGQTNKTANQVYRGMKRAEKAGKITSRKILEGGHWVWVYCPTRK